VYYDSTSRIGETNDMTLSVISDKPQEENEIEIDMS